MRYFSFSFSSKLIIEFQVDKQRVPNADKLEKNRSGLLKLASVCLNLILNSMRNIP